VTRDAREGAAKKVLFISYFFPPVGGGGVQRSVKFVKYLPAFGWAPIVLTSRQAYDFDHDDTLLAEIPPETQVHRTTSVEPMRAVRRVVKRRWERALAGADGGAAGARGSLKPRLLVALKNALFVPDNEIPWLPFAVGRGCGIIARERPDAIYSTASPYTDHLVALQLARRSGLPWIADFRDFWVDRASFPPIRWRRAIERKLELQVLREASHVVTVSPLITETFRGRVPAQGYTTIPNGYDEADFAGAPDAGPEPGIFRLTYTGILNKERDATPVFEALARLLAARADLRERLRLRLVGRLDDPGDFTNINALAAHGLEALAERSPYLPHARVIREMRRADVLLLLIGRYPRCEADITGKLFEYLRARRPILAVVPPGGAAARIVEGTRSGVVAAPDDPAAIARGIEQLFDAWNAGNLDAGFRWEGIEAYERRRLTGELAGVLDRVVTAPRR
jgi:glycosyltransferase involved in cell wall biosynthesis